MLTFSGNKNFDYVVMLEIVAMEVMLVIVALVMMVVIVLMVMLVEIVLEMPCNQIAHSRSGENTHVHESEQSSVTEVEKYFFIQ